MSYDEILNSFVMEDVPAEDEEEEDGAGKETETPDDGELGNDSDSEFEEI